MRPINRVIILLLFTFNLYAQEKVNQINAPTGYTRVFFPTDSYSGYIQNLPLKQDNTIYEWDGSKLWASLFLYNILAVVDKPLLYKEDLEQCADYSMRFYNQINIIDP